MICTRIFLVLALFAVLAAPLPQQAWARTPEGQACVQNLAYQRRSYPIDLNHRFPMSHSQGEDGTCYAHALLSGLSAIQQQDLKDDSSLFGDKKAFVQDFDYSPELTLLLLTLLDDEYARERVESARQFQKTRIFDSGYPAKLYARIKIYPQTLISLPNHLKLSLWLSVRGALRSAFEKVTDLGTGATVEELRERIRSELPPILEAAQKKPELSGWISELRKKGWQWDAKKKELKTHLWPNWLPYSMRVVVPKTMNECVRMQDEILTSLCEGKPVLITFPVLESPGVFHTTVLTGIFTRNGRQIFMMRDSKIRDAEGTPSTPHRTLAPFHLDESCQLWNGTFRISRADIFDGLNLER